MSMCGFACASILPDAYAQGDRLWGESSVLHVSFRYLTALRSSLRFCSAEEKKGSFSSSGLPRGLKEEEEQWKRKELFLTICVCKTEAEDMTLSLFITRFFVGGFPHLLLFLKDARTFVPHTRAYRCLCTYTCSYTYPFWYVCVRMRFVKCGLLSICACTFIRMHLPVYRSVQVFVSGQEKKKKKTQIVEENA